MKPAQHKSQLVAIVDDDEEVRSAVQSVLKSAGFQPQSFPSAEEFLRSGTRTETACLITDLQMPGMDGFELQARLTEDGDGIPIIFITAYGNARTRMRAMESGALDFLEKPFDDAVLLERVRTALER
jgi:FixJ family two-component response regulator